MTADGGHGRPVPGYDPGADRVVPPARACA